MPTNETYRLDDLDFAILTHLQNEGRKSFTEIAEDLGVALGTVRNRVARMVDNGQVDFIARVDPSRLGFDAYANIHISVRPSMLIEQVAKEIAAFPEVNYLALVAGEYDLEVDVACPDNNHLTSLIADRIHKIEGVVNTNTSMVLRTYKIDQVDLGLVHHSSILPQKRDVP